MFYIDIKIKYLFIHKWVKILDTRRNFLKSSIHSFLFVRLHLIEGLLYR